MRPSQVVNNLPRFTPALMDIAGSASLLPHLGYGIQGFSADLKNLGALPKFEHSPWSRVLPVNAGLNASPGDSANLGSDRNGQAYNIMSVHGQIRGALSQGIDAMEHLTGYGSELGVVNKIRAGRAIKKFAGFAVIRAIQVDFSGSRNNGYSDDGEGIYIAQHRDSYKTLRPLMSRKFRRLAKHAIAKHSR